MKIGNSIEGVKSDAGIGGAGRAGSSSTGPVAPAAAADRIDLSETSRTLAGGEAQSASFRADKVNEVRLALERGEYKVDSRVVAERMIIESAQLLETIAGGVRGSSPADSGANPAGNR
jgi:flagellar biosynthesis anti-sigma factor FlgM